MDPAIDEVAKRANITVVAIQKGPYKSGFVPILSINCPLGNIDSSIRSSTSLVSTSKYFE